MNFNKMGTHGTGLKHRFRHLDLHRYERYLPTAFDESDSLLEKTNKVIENLYKVVEVVSNHEKDTKKWSDDVAKEIEKELNEIEKELNEFKETLIDTIDEYEKFRHEITDDIIPELFINKMDEWIVDGSLYDLINQSVFENINSRLNELESRVDPSEEE